MDQAIEVDEKNASKTALKMKREQYQEIVLNGNNMKLSRCNPMSKTSRTKSLLKISSIMITKTKKITNKKGKSNITSED
jgi:hypothetical protein